MRSQRAALRRGRLPPSDRAQHFLLFHKVVTGTIGYWGIPEASAQWYE